MGADCVNSLHGFIMGADCVNSIDRLFKGTHTSESVILNNILLEVYVVWRF